MAVIPEPEWLSSFNAKRKPGFQPGQSGNPAGRAKGSKNKKTLLAEELEKQAHAVQNAVVAAALAGDTTCMGLVMARVHPPLRARSQTVGFELDASRSLSEQAQQVLVAVSQGKVDPETGQMLVSLISSFAGIRQVDDLQKRIERLEAQR